MVLFVLIVKACLGSTLTMDVLKAV